MNWDMLSCWPLSLCGFGICMGSLETFLGAELQLF